MKIILWNVSVVILTLMLLTNVCEAKRYKFKEDNYSIKLDKSWELNKSSDASSIAQMFYSYELKQSLIIRKLPNLVLEDSKLPENKKEFVTFLKNNYLKTQFEKILSMMENDFAIVPLKIAGYDSFLANIKGNSKNTPITSSMGIIQMEKGSGYSFTLVNVGHKDVTKEQIQNITKDFKILKKKPKQKKIKLKASKKFYQSFYYGYEVPYFEGMMKASIADIGLTQENAIINHIQISIKHGFVFMVSSFCNDEVQLTKKQILSSLIAGFDNTLEPFTIQTDKDGEIYASGKLYDDNIKTLVYYYKVKKIENCSHVAINFDTTDKGLSALNQFISQIQPLKIDKSRLSNSLRVKNNQIHANIQASIGLHLESVGDSNSLKLLKEATKLQPTNPVLLEHYLNALNKREQFNKGLKAIEQANEEMTKAAGFQSWKAVFLAKTEDTNHAIAIYKDLFSKQYTNDEDFFIYISLLESKEKWTDMLKEINAHKNNVSKQKSLKLKHAIAYAKTGDSKKAEDILSSIINSKNFDDYGFYDVLDVFFQMKKYSKGIELIETKINTDGGNITDYFYLGDFQYNARKSKLALKSMQKALEFEPLNQTIKNYIAGINSQNGVGNIEITKTPIKALTLPKQIQKDISNQKLVKTERPVSNYYYINGYHFEKNKVLTQTYFRKYKINDLQSADNVETLQIKFNEEYEHPYINKFTVTDLKTKKVTQLDRDTIYITSINDGISADGDKYLNIPIPSIANNTEIEYIISVQSNAKTDKFVLETDFFVSIHPYLYMASFVQGDVKDITSNHSDKIEFIQQKSLKIWKSKQIDLYKQESNRPDSHETFQWLEIASTKKSWKQAGNDYLNQIKGKLNSNLSKGQLLSILPDSRDSFTVAKELAAFVQSNITYQALEFGSRASIPNTTKQTLQNKYGDCKDHAVMLYDLLSKKGIKAHLALVNTEGYVNSELATIDQFNHVVVYLPKINGGVFIDTTDKYTAIDLKIPPRSVQGGKALILEKNRSRLIDIPSITAEQNTLVIERSIKQNKHLYISTQTAVITGYIASEIRAYLQPLNKEHIKTEINQWVNVYYPNLIIDEFSYYNLEQLGKPLILEFQFSQNSNNSDFKVPAFLERVYLTFNAYEKRLYPFKLYESFSITSKTTTTDKNLKLTDLDESYSSKSLSWQFEKNKKQQNFSVTLNSGTYAADDYQVFFDSLRRALFKIEKSIIVK